MLTPPFLEQEEQRLEVLSDNYLSPVPREERFDRVTRTAMRLLEVPVAFLALSGDDGVALRSAQGLPAHLTASALAFCDPQLQGGQPLLVPDASVNPLFWHNPLVSSGPRLRCFAGVPLQPTPGGARGGVLCAMHTEPRSLRQSHLLALQDLARLAESELRLEALTAMHKRVVARLGQLERRGHFDSVTGCWSVRRFRELLAEAVSDTQARGGALALCYVRVRDFDLLAAGAKGAQDGLRQAIAQALRRRLPDGGALGSLGGADFCALLPAPTEAAADRTLARFCEPAVLADAGDARVQLAFGCASLHELGAQAGATEIWAQALSRLQR